MRELSADISAESTAPKTLAGGRFVLHQMLGAGGMGVVYLAFDQERQQLVALKTLNHLSGAGIYRFKQEFRSLADLVHPNIISLYELLSDGDQWFFTMELLKGVDLMTWCRTHRAPSVPEGVTSDSSDAIDIGDKSSLELMATESAVPLDDSMQSLTHSQDDALPIVKPQLPPPAPRPALGPYPEPTPEQWIAIRAVLHQLASGIHALHAAQKLHRDIKPSNVLVTDAGRLVLLDFGLALDLDSGLGPPSTPELAGTLVFMSPEQLKNETLSTASDWYSVGIILYQLLTGSIPFAWKGLSMVEMVAERTRTDPPSPRSRVPWVPADLDALCTALLRRSAADRPRRTWNPPSRALRPAVWPFTLLWPATVWGGSLGGPGASSAWKKQVCGWRLSRFERLPGSVLSWRRGLAPGPHNHRVDGAFTHVSRNPGQFD